VQKLFFATFGSGFAAIDSAILETNLEFDSLANFCDQPLKILFGKRSLDVLILFNYLTGSASISRMRLIPSADVT